MVLQEECCPVMHTCEGLHVAALRVHGQLRQQSGRATQGAASCVICSHEVLDTCLRSSRDERWACSSASPFISEHSATSPCAGARASPCSCREALPAWLLRR